MVFRIIGRTDPLYACIAAIICTKHTIRTSFEVSKDRMTGTVIGGAVGAVYLQVLSYSNIPFEILVSIGIVTVIYLCNLIKEQGTVSLSCVVFLLIMFNFKNSESTMPYLYAFNRIIDTAIGIAISLIVNKYLFPYKEKEIEGDRN